MEILILLGTFAVNNNKVEIIIQTMKVLVDILDNEAVFGMKVLKSLPFVKKTRPMTQATVELWEDLKSAAQDVRLHKQGKLNLKTAQDLLNEL